MYETGVLVALALWALNIVSTLVRNNSQLARNFKKVGLRLSWMTGQPVPSDERSSAGWILAKIIFLYGLGLASVLLSWLAVAWFAGNVVYQWRKNSGAPAAIKELQWKMRNFDMSEQQVLAAIDQANRLIAPEAGNTSPGAANRTST